MTTDKDRLKSEVERFGSWFIQQALPLWADAGYDFDHGGFYECLNFNGQPVKTAPRRVRVQARQIYVFSRVSSFGWHEDAGKLADLGFQYFLEKACPDNGARGCVHTLASDGSVIDDRRDLYDQAFLLLACAWRWRTAKDQRAMDIADSTIDFLNRELRSEHGGWIEDDKNTMPRRQNPHMHLLEAFMALFDATGDEKYLAHGDRVFDLFSDHFFDAKYGVLREFFTNDWHASPGETGNRIEPGHMVEWIWLLDVYADRRGVAIDRFTPTLFEQAQKIGKDPNSNFLFDGCVLGQSKTESKRRLWPQTEYLKALSIRYSNGDALAGERASEVINDCFKTYLNQPVAGLWCDQYDCDGTPCAQDVPASILYHLLDALLVLSNSTDVEFG